MSKIKSIFKGISAFLYRFFYSFRLVFITNPFILFIMIFIAVIQGAVPVISSLISQSLINSLQNIAIDVSQGAEIPNVYDSGLLKLTIFMFLFQILNRLTTRLSNYTSRITGEQVVKTVKLKIMEKSKEIDLSSYDTPEFYEKLENANREAGTRPVTILNNTFTVISTLISMISYLTILASALPFAALAIAVVTVPSAIINFIYRRKNAEYVRNKSKYRREMNYYAERAVNRDVAKEVRIFGLADTFIKSFKASFLRYFNGLKKLIIHENIWQSIFLICSSAVNFACYVYIIGNVLTGSFLIGDFTLYTSALTTLANEINTLINTSATIYEGTLFIDNLIAFLNEESHITNPKLPCPSPRRNVGHRIEFRDVSFKYPGSDVYVLKHINLVFEPGENITLVGLNGAGKTTLIKLMTRLYDPTEGCILLDDIDIRQYSLDDLYPMYGIIFQDFGKYAYSVGENIHFGDVKSEYSEEMAYAAAKCADATDFIEKLPEKLNTPLTRAFEKDGTDLSGGQWQKVAIARSFYGKSDILILDEPTAALDPMAENEIYNQFTQLSGGKTTIFVSHRLSSAVSSDKIVVLENGGVAEQGTHKELMALKGKYYLLFTTQAKKYEDGQILQNKSL